MTKKEFFERGLYLDLRIRNLQERLLTLEALCTGTGMSISGMPRNPNRGGSRLEDLQIAIADIKEEIQQLLVYKAALQKAISSLEDPMQQIVMGYRYIDRMQWKDIASEVYLSDRQLYRIRDKAIENAVLPEEIKDVT